MYNDTGKKEYKSDLKDRDFIFSLSYFNRPIEIDNNQTLIENNIRVLSNNPTLRKNYLIFLSKISINFNN